MRTQKALASIIKLKLKIKKLHILRPSNKDEEKEQGKIKSKGWIKAFLYDKKFVVILREDTFIYCKKSNPNIEIPIGFLKDIG